MKRRRSVPFLVLFSLLSVGPGAARPWEPTALLVRVVDAGGRPVAAATVHVGPEIAEYSDSTAGHRREETAADGTVRFSDLPADETLWLLVEKKGFFPVARNAEVPAGESREIREIRVALQPGGVAVGRVVDEAGRPVAGVEVELSGKPFGLWTGDLPAFLREKATIRARTGPAGRFRFHDLPEGSFALTLRHPGYAPVEADYPVVSRTGDLGRFVLRRGTTLNGLVTDPDGRPLAGISVGALTGDEDWSGDVPPSAATTGPDGTFTLPHLPSGEAELIFCSQGFLPNWQTVPFPEEPVYVTLRPGALLRGQVLGPDGAPLAGASLWADQTGADPGCAGTYTPCGDTAAATTDAEGRFSVGPLPPGWYNVQAKAPGLLKGSAEKVRAPAGEQVEGIEIRMGTGGTLAGRVLDSAGSPIAGARVTAISARTSAHAISAADGSYQLAGIDTGPVTALVLAAGYLSLHQEIEPDTGARQADLVLKRGSTVRFVEAHGRVLGPGGAPIEGALVQASANQTWSTADGSFALSIPDRPEEIQLLATKQGYSSGLVSVEPGGAPVLGIEIRLEAGAIVSGRVPGLVPEDRNQVVVILERQGASPLEAPLAEDGTFRLEHVASGIWTVRAQAADRAAETSLPVRDDGSEAFVEIELPPAHPATGRVLDGLGRPVAGASLSLLLDDFAELRGSTRADGSFLLRLQDGQQPIRVQGEGFQPVDLTVQVNGGPVAGLEVRLEPAASLRGRIFGLAPGEVPAIWAHGSDELWTVDVGVDGDYAITGLTPGQWQLDIRLSDRPRDQRVLRRTIEIPPGSTEMHLDLDFAEAIAEAIEEP